MAKKAKNKRTQKTFKHHAKRLIKKTPPFVHGMITGAFVGVIVVTMLSPNMPARAWSLDSPVDCDTNAVLRCGARNTTVLGQRYNDTRTNPGAKDLYRIHYGITSKHIDTMGTIAVPGRVYRDDNTVKTCDSTGKICTKTVATKAITAGRLNISGSKRIKAGDYTFYERPPRTSFRIESIAAYVVIKDGEFKFAILAACGNPVRATPVPKPEPEPEPEPIPPPSTQTPPSQPTPEVSTELPNTGPGDIVIVALFAIIGGYVFHATHRHVRRRLAMRRG